MGTREEVLKACEEWDGTESSFQDLVAQFRDLGILTDREVASKLEMAPMTFARYANKLAIPLPGMQVVTIKYLIKVLKSNGNEKEISTFT